MAGDLLFQPWNELDNRPHREVLIPHILHMTGITTLVAPSTWGKTTIAHALARVTMAGAEWAGTQIQPRPVLWLIGEDRETVSALNTAWNRAHPNHSYQGWFLEDQVIDFSNEFATDQLIRFLDGKPPCLIVADTLADMIGLCSENEAKDMNRVYKNLERVKKINESTILMLHHTGWNTEREKGTVAIRNKSDAMLIIKKWKPVEGRIELDHLKWRGGQRQKGIAYKVELVWVEGLPEKVPIVTGQLLGMKPADMEEGKLSRSAESAFTILEEYPAGLSWLEWKDTWASKANGSGQPTSKSAFDRAIRELKEAGLIDKVKADGEGEVKWVVHTLDAEDGTLGGNGHAGANGHG